MGRHRDHPPSRQSRRTDQSASYKSGGIKAKSGEGRGGASSFHERSYFLVTPVLMLIFCVMSYVAVSYYWRHAKARWFPIRTVQLAGQVKNIDGGRLMVLLKKKPLYFFSVDLQALTKSLRRYFPWVRSLEVKKVWPSTLVIKIQEYQPVASWNHQQLLDSKGLVFTKPLQNNMLINALPELYGPEQQELMVWNTYLACRDIVSPLHLHIKTASLSNNGQWRLVLDNGVSIYIGAKQVQLRLRRLVQLYALLLKQGGASPAGFDLRYPHAIAVQLAH